MKITHYMVEVITINIILCAVIHFLSTLACDCCSYVPTHSNTYVHGYHTQWKGTALCAAIQFEHEDIIEILLEAKADPNLQNEVFCTPLIL